MGRPIPAGTNVIFLNAAASDRLTAENGPNLRALDGLRSESSLKHGLGGRGLWVNPDKFNPERWLVDDGSGQKTFNPKAGVTNPFGLGVRACPGKNFAVRHPPHSSHLHPLTLASLQQLVLKIFIATLNLAFFFDEVPEELDSYKPILGISRAPRMAYVAPRPWHEGE